MNWTETRELLIAAGIAAAGLPTQWLPAINLRGAYLSEAYLSGANLSWANLSEANLSRANLRGADLRGANLRGADLSEANLRGADLRGARLPHFLIVQQQGAFIGWKKTRGGVIKLEIPANAHRCRFARRPQVQQAVVDIGRQDHGVDGRPQRAKGRAGGGAGERG